MKIVFKKHTKPRTSFKSVILGDNEFQGWHLCFKHLWKPLLTLGSRCTHRCHHFSLGICLWECLSSPETVSSLTVRTDIVLSSPIPSVQQNTLQHSRCSVFTEWITHIFFYILLHIVCVGQVSLFIIPLPFGNSLKIQSQVYRKRPWYCSISLRALELTLRAILKRTFIGVNRQALNMNNLKSSTWMYRNSHMVLKNHCE